MYTRAGEIYFASLYRTQIGAHGVLWHASQFDLSTNKVKMILLKSKAIGRSGRCDPGTGSDDDVVE